MKNDKNEQEDKFLSLIQIVISGIIFLCASLCAEIQIYAVDNKTVFNYIIAIVFVSITGLLFCDSYMEFKSFFKNRQ